MILECSPVELTHKTKVTFTSSVLLRSLPFYSVFFFCDTVVDIGVAGLLLRSFCYRVCSFSTVATGLLCDTSRLTAYCP